MPLDVLARAVARLRRRKQEYVDAAGRHFAEGRNDLAGNSLIRAAGIQDAIETIGRILAEERAR